VWTPYTLSFIDPKGNGYYLYDPEDYIDSNENIKEINKLLTEIEKEFNYEVFIYIIAEYSKDYSDLGEFITELSNYKVRNRKKSYIEKTIFFIFSITDQKFIFKTGSYLKSSLSDKNLLDYVEEIKLKLGNDFSAGLVILLTSIKLHFKNKSYFKFPEIIDTSGYLFSIFDYMIRTIIYFAIFFCIYSCCSEKKNNQNENNDRRVYYLENPQEEIKRNYSRQKYN